MIQDNFMAVLILLSKVCALSQSASSFHTSYPVGYLLLCWGILLTVLAFWMVVDLNFFQLPSLTVDDADRWGHLSWALIREPHISFL